MNNKYVVKEAFVIIGKEAVIKTSKNNKGIFEALLNEILANLAELKAVAKLVDGEVSGVWAMMTNTQKQSFSFGLGKRDSIYFIGVESDLATITPSFWQKHQVIAYSYYIKQIIKGDEFLDALQEMRKENKHLIGPAYLYYDLISKEKFWYLPYQEL